MRRWRPCAARCWRPSACSPTPLRLGASCCSAATAAAALCRTHRQLETVEYALATDLSVAENIYLDRLLAGSGGGKTINYKKLNKNAHDLLDSLGFGHIKETEIVSELSIAYQQVVEICKALSKPSI